MVEYANFLSQLDNDAQHRLSELAVIREVIDDEFISSLGNNTEDVYILVDGRVKIYELTEEGKEVILWFCGDGELIGFAESLVSSQFSGHSINAQACGYGRLMVIKHLDFVDFMSENPAVILPVVKLLGFRLREVSEVLMDITTSDVASRVIKLLSRLGGLYGKSVEGGVYVDIPITHQEMADMIGTSRQSVTTVLGELKRKGLIRIEHRMILIQNEDLMHSFFAASAQSDKTPILDSAVRSVNLEC